MFSVMNSETFLISSSEANDMLIDDNKYWEGIYLKIFIIVEIQLNKHIEINLKINVSVEKKMEKPNST